MGEHFLSAPDRNSFILSPKKDLLSIYTVSHHAGFKEIPNSKIMAPLRRDHRLGGETLL